MSIRIDLVRDLRELATYRISFHDHSVSHTLNCSTLVGNSSGLGTPRLELLSLESNVDNHIGIFNISSSGTESLSFASGIGETKINFSEPITDNSTTKSSLIKFESHGGNASGYMILTFQKKEGFENIGPARRKPTRPNAYR